MVVNKALAVVESQELVGAVVGARPVEARLAGGEGVAPYH